MAKNPRQPPDVVIHEFPGKFPSWSKSGAGRRGFLACQSLADSAPKAAMTRLRLLYTLCVHLRRLWYVFEGLCLCWSVTTVNADVPKPLSASHICVCMKKRPYVGVCLINCEGMWETVCLFIWLGDGGMEGGMESRMRRWTSCFCLLVDLLAVTQTSSPPPTSSTDIERGMGEGERG